MMATKLESGEIQLTSVEAKTLLFLHGDFARAAHRATDARLDALISTLSKIAAGDIDAAEQARRSRPAYAPKGRETRSEAGTRILAQQTTERLVLAQWMRRLRAKGADAVAALDRLLAERVTLATTNPEMQAVRAAVAAALA